jgi:hypothetical protein
MILLDSTLRTVLIGLVPLIVIVPLVVFWVWMFKDMMNNDDLPSVFKPYWLMAFILLNIPAAVFYYYTVYKSR